MSIININGRNNNTTTQTQEETVMSKINTANMSNEQVIKAAKDFIGELGKITGVRTMADRIKVIMDNGDESTMGERISAAIDARLAALKENYRKGKDDGDITVLESVKESGVLAASAEVIGNITGLGVRKAKEVGGKAGAALKNAGFTMKGLMSDLWRALCYGLSILKSVIIAIIKLLLKLINLIRYAAKALVGGVNTFIEMRKYNPDDEDLDDFEDLEDLVDETAEELADENKQ